MNADHKRKILDVIADCDRYIAREEPRNPTLRPADVAQRLEWYKAHRQKLIGMLAAEK